MDSKQNLAAAGSVCFSEQKVFPITKKQIIRGSGQRKGDANGYTGDGPETEKESETQI